MPDPAEIRSQLVDALRLDLIGPTRGHELDSEVLPNPPSRWYLTGFLVPYEAAEHQKMDETSAEQMEIAGVSEASDDNDTPEQVSKRKAFFPSSIGISALVRDSTGTIHVEVEWGDYRFGEEEKQERWTRSQHIESVDVKLGKGTKPKSVQVPNSDGLQLTISLRPVPPSIADAVGCPCRSLSVFLVNQRSIDSEVREKKDEAFIFQARLRIHNEGGFVARPNLKGLEEDDLDERIADLQYRDAFEYAVGHGVSTHALRTSRAECHEIRTEWIPEADVEKVLPARIDGVALGMEAIAAAPDATTLQAMLTPISARYGEWIEEQAAKAPKERQRRETVDFLLQRARVVRDRISHGIELLHDPEVFEAFRIANKTMARSARQRALQAGIEAKGVKPPEWRPFQLAFLLMNLASVADPTHKEREVVDLLFFPTGGGKTEAYLGLAAFTLVMRRLRNPGVASAGLAVLMRYTLRLLTLDQLSRASTLICALELERKSDSRLGTWPFEIGLWVGSAATPNTMGKKGDNDQHSARAKVNRFKADSRSAPSPIPLENCPWCGAKFKPDSFNLYPNEHHPKDLRITCLSRDCDFKQNNPLPILTVDEAIYRRLPCFLIATVDKFASLPWVGRSGALLGNVQRFDPREGFFGPCDPGVGQMLESPLLPPDLVIQDELHLISGPLGTMVGLYESAIDALMSRQVDGRMIRPKIVASTATVRRAEAQIKALFARQTVDIFPPPGPDRRDSFFARTVATEEANGRRYVGLAAPGRSLKVLLLRSYLALLGASQKAYLAAGGKIASNPADPYMTLVGYFNSLRELGGSRRIVEDEVRSRLSAYGEKKRVGEAESLFANRQMDTDVVELTSREATNKVADTKRRLALPYPEEGRVDVALATNMISVGLDITRLGLMVVLGQPKTAAEYIQASSRVGREDTRPGLVVTLFNVNRPRDRSHYERFEFFHETFYRAVEATSVTPFSPRAIDRGLAAITVALARHSVSDMTAPLTAREIAIHREAINRGVEAISQRATAIGLGVEEGERVRQKVRTTITELLDDWSRIAHEKQDVGVSLQYNKSEEAGARGLLLDPLDPEIPKLRPRERRFKANRSLRDVEPNVNLHVKAFDNSEVPEEMA